MRGRPERRLLFLCTQFNALYMPRLTALIPDLLIIFSMEAFNIQIIVLYFLGN